MPPPSPPVALRDHCSIIYNNTLYVYSPDAFQSLPLLSGAEWNQLPTGISLTGATCEKGGIDGDSSRPALYVVGGSTNSSSIQYPGLQRFSILENTWTSITPIVQVTQNRQHHGTAYLNQSSSILVYGGSQDGDSNLSTQTFLISTVPPYGVQSYESAAPPVVDPTLVTWNYSHAAVVGGSSSNANVFTFGPDQAWVYAGVTLPQPLPGRPHAQSVLLSLDDGSKVLETFDMSQSPNTVTRTVILTAGGAPAAYGQTVGGNNTSSASPSATNPSRSRKRKRDISLSSFPTYNSTLAPTDTRSGFSISQDQQGLVVFAGGSDTDPLCVFNQTDNGWVNATQMLEIESQQPLTSASATTTPTSSSTSSASSSASTNAVAAPKHQTGTVLAAVLGGIFGVLAILLIVLLVLRILHKRKARRSSREKSQFSDDKNKGKAKKQTSLPLSNAGQPMGRSPVPSADYSAVISGGIGVGKTTQPQPPPQLQERSGSSLSGRSRLESAKGSSSTHYASPGMFSRTKGPPAISKPILQEQGAELQERSFLPPHRPSRSQDRPETAVSIRQALREVEPASNKNPPPGIPVLDGSSSDAAHPALAGSHRKTDEGWSKYFQGNNAVNLTEDRPPYENPSLESNYQNSYWPDSSAPDGPFMSPGLTDSDGNHLSELSVARGSPILGHASGSGSRTGLAVSEGVPGRISSADSLSSGRSDQDDYEDDIHHDAEHETMNEPYVSNIPPARHEMPWAPVGNAWAGPPHRLVRRPSSEYSTTGIPMPLSPSKSSNIPPFPMPNSNIRPLTHWPEAESSQRGTLDSHMVTTMTPPARRPPTSTRDYLGAKPTRAQYDNTDVSWLNLSGGR